VALDPTNAQVLYAGADQRGVFKSIDGGLSWSASSGFSEKDSISALAIDPLAAASVYAAGTPGVLKSDDAARSWRRVLPGFPGPIPISLAINPSNPSVVYAGTKSKSFPFSAPMYESLDHGASWNVTFVDQAAEIASLLLNPQEPSTIYEADYNYGDFDYVGSSKVYASTDGGAHWSQAGDIPAGASRAALVKDPASPSTFFLGTLQGLYKSVDGGRTWSLASSDLANAVVNAVAVDPRHPGIVYAGTFEGVYRSVDGGTSWSAFNEGLTSLEVRALAIDRTGTRLHAGTVAGVFDYQIPPSGALDLSVGLDNNLNIVSGDAEGRALFQTLDRSGNSARGGPFGPYSGWIPTAISSGMDGLTRVLWNNEEGSAALWLMSGQGNEASYLLDAPSGLLATDVAASLAGVTHVLWADADGRIAITSVDNSGRGATGPTYGPYPGWTAVAASDGPDGRTRVLWRNLDGTTAISFAQEGRLLVSQGFAAVPGWTAHDITVGGDGLTRILWSHQDDRAALWIVDAAGKVTAYGPVYPAPAGMSAQRLAAGPDGSARVLFTDGQGGALLWLLSAAGAFESAFELSGADSAEGAMAGDWTGTFSSDNVEFCVFDGIPAQATFHQRGSYVSGILNAPTAPCFKLESRAFIGTSRGTY
jgi:photosystem II stability/assembly factor-like uncharacterized protein